MGDASTCDASAPLGLPQLVLEHSTIICRLGLALQHDNQARIPAWVTYSITREQTLGCEPRTGRFVPDPLLPGSGQSHVRDYRGSGYDQGHMAPNAALSWSRVAQHHSFFLSNVVPQTPSLNRAAWRELESAVRTWAFERGWITVHVGPIYHRNSNRLIGGRVVVPHALFKIVVDHQSRTSLAFVIPQDTHPTLRFHRFQTTVSMVESETGIVFPTPDSPHMLHLVWTSNMRELNLARRGACHSSHK